MAYPTVQEHHKRYPDTSIMASPYSCDPTGVTDIAAAIEQLKSDQSSTGTVVVPKGTYKVATNLTLPVGMLFRFESAASFAVADGVTLTVNCSLEYPEGASPFTASGTGIITIGTSFPVTSHTLKLPRGTWDITENTTIPSNVNLKLDKGAILTVATTKTLTINGPLEAGSYQIFPCTGTGDVVFGLGTVDKVLPHWWYDGGGDWAPALQAAIIAVKDAAVLGKVIAKVFCPSGTYDIDSRVDFYNSVGVQGSGKGTVFVPTGNHSAFGMAENLWSADTNGYYDLLTDCTIDASANANNIDLIYLDKYLNMARIKSVNFIGNISGLQNGIDRKSVV
jgi:hypothetical protein